MMPVVRLLVDPSSKNVSLAYEYLVRQRYLGSRVGDLLADLPALVHLARNLDYYIALYGARRVYDYFFSKVGSVPPQARLIVLADAFRFDKTIGDELAQALLEERRRLIAMDAPPQLVAQVDNILNAIVHKPGDVYSLVIKFVYDARLVEELGSEVAGKYIMAAPVGTYVSGAGVSEQDLSRVVHFVYNRNYNGLPVSTRDIATFVGSTQRANEIIRELKKRDLIQYDASVRSYVVTNKGLAFIGRGGSEADLLQRLGGGT